MAGSDENDTYGETTDSGINDATVVLLTWLSTTIARDGGASLVTSLKDHYWRPLGPKRLNALLCASPIGKPKLLRFLEYFDIFEVDRQATPHYVVLKDTRHVVDANSHLPLQEENSRYHAILETLLDFDKMRSQAAETLRSKVEYIFRRRTARLIRRHDEKSQEPAIDSNALKVNLQWLVKQCPWELHFYLRAIDFYRQHYSASTTEVARVMSEEWQGLVRSALETFLVTDTEGFASDDMGKVWFLEDLNILEAESIETTLAVNQQTADNQNTAVWLDQLEAVLTQLVHTTGGTQIRLALLLHRQDKLKRLLGGRDLESILRDHPARFQGIQSRSEGTDLILEATLPDNNEHQQRMKVDRVGLFSVTNSKWSTAIANILVQLCRTHTNLEQCVAVDLTASVGGMTLGLAKKEFFKSVLALEIDPQRADFCAQNMKDHGVDHKVEVRNVDSIAAIPTLPNRCCVVIDPPWGGEDYKKYKDKPPLNLGETSLEQVLQKMAHAVDDFVVGMRLPVTLIIADFLDRLREQYSLTFETLTIRKLSVQLFVVLKFGTWR